MESISISEKMTLLMLTCLMSAGCSPTAQAQKQFKALLFTKTAGWHHESINAGVDAIKKMADDHHFELVWSDHAARWFTDEMLAGFQVIIFLNTTGDVLNDAEQAAMERFIRSGKGFVGIHSASDTEYGWPWYTQLVGRNFVSHPAIQTARLNVVDRNFPGLEHLPGTFWFTDEWYNFSEEKTAGLRYLLTIDESSYSPSVKWDNVESKGMGSFHPIAWCHEFDGGRSFYTAIGHLSSKYVDADFLAHLYGGIFWAAKGG